MWSGELDPGHALALAEQLKLNPESRVRALWLGSIEYMGWSPVQHVLANLYDLMLSIAFGIGGKRPPASARYPRPAPEPQKPTTIADFNIEQFMRTLNQ